MELLFRTVHGSFLYGLNHENSDNDTFEVWGWSKFKPKHRVAGGDDVVKTSFDRFMLYCNRGVPQYLEAMFSNKWDTNRIEFITAFYRPDMVETRDRYKRTIKNFWMEGVEEDSFKKRRHAVRLRMNLSSMEVRGRFDPTMNTGEIGVANYIANHPERFHESMIGAT